MPHSQMRTSPPLIARLSWLLPSLAVGIFALQSETHAQFTFATDTATDAAYSSGLANGDNGGSGFNAWSITYGNGTSTFVGNPATDGMGTTGIGTTAWGARAPGATTGWVNASRQLSTSMQIGDSLSFYWAVNYSSGGSGGSKGFDLKAGGTNLFTLENTNSSTISYKNAGTGTVSGNYGVTPMLVTVNRTGSSEYQISITRRDPAEGTFYLTVNSALNLDTVNFYEGRQSGTDGRQNTYFNNLLNANSGNYNTGGSRTESRALVGSGNLVVSNGTNLTLTNAGNTFTGTTTIQSGTLSLGNGGADGFIGSTSSISNNGSLIYNLTSSGTLGMAISGTGSLVKQGSGTLTLSGSNTYTGATTISVGTLALGASDAISDSSAVSVAGGSTLSLGGYSDTVGKLTGAGSVSLGSGTLTTTWGSGSGTFSGVISGTGGLTVAGAADYNAYFTISGTNTYTGDTTLTGATLILGADNTISSSSALVVSGGQLSASNRNQTFSSITMDAGSILRDGGSLAYTNGANLTGGSITIRNNGGSINTGGLTTLGNVTLTYNASTANFDAMVLGGDVAVNAGSTAVFATGPAGGQGFIKLGDTNRVFDVDAGGNLNMNWQITSNTLSAGSLTKNGTGTLTLNVGSIYTGGTTINAGTLALGHATNTLADTGAVTINGGTLSLGSNDDTVGVLTLSGGSIAGTSGVLTASSYALQNGTVAAILGGSASINKTTAGVVTLAANNTFTGGVTLADGQLNLNAAGALGSGNFTISGGTLGNTAGTTVVLSSSAAQFWNGNFSFAGPDELNLGTGAVTMDASRTVTVDSGTLTVGGAISGSGFTLSKNGTGTMVLGGANTYSGATVVNAGTLAIGASDRIADSSNLFVASGATFSMNGFSDTVAKLTGTGSVSLGSGTLTTTWGSGSGSFSGVISGTGGFTVAGAADNNAYFTISGNNTYTGDTTLTGATLILGANNGISSSSALVVSGGRLSASNYNQTFSSITMDAGSIFRDGGTLAYTNGANLTGGSILIRNNGGSISTGGLTTLGNVTLTYNASAANFNAMVLGGDVAVNAGATALFEAGPAGGVGFIKLGDTNRVFDVDAGGILNMNWLITSNTLSAGSLTKNGSGTLTLNVGSTYTGGTTINDGTLVLGHGTNTLADTGAVIINGGTLSIGSNSDTVGVLTLSGGSIAGTSGILTASSYALQSGTISAILGGSASINKTTAGTVELNAANTFTGNTDIVFGTLEANVASALGSTGNITVHNGGSLLVQADNAIGDSTNLVLAGGTLEFAGDINETVGALTLSANSTIDMGGGNIALLFSDLVAGLTNTTRLNIYNYTLYSDHIYFTSDANLESSLQYISFYSGFGTGFIGNSFIQGLAPYEVRPVPEPETWITAGVLLALAGFHIMKRKSRTARTL